MSKVIERTIFRSVGTLLFTLAGISAFQGNFIGAAICGIFAIAFYLLKDYRESEKGSKKK